MLPQTEIVVGGLVGGLLLLLYLAYKYISQLLI